MYHMGANRSEVVQAVHRLDVDLDVSREVERSTEIGVQLTWRKGSRPPVVDTYAVGRGRRQLVAAHRGEATGDGRPRVRVDGRFSSDVSGVELGDGDIEVVDVEHDNRRNPLIGVDPDDDEKLRKKGFDPFAAREANAREGKVPASGRHDGPRHICRPQLGDRPHVRHLGVSTIEDSRAHHPTAIFIGQVVGKNLRHGVPIARREVR